MVRDVRYRNVRDPITPTAYVPFRLDAVDEAASDATFLVRTSNPKVGTLNRLAYILLR